MSELLNVFIVDDDDIYQFLTQKELEKTGKTKTISKFSDGKKALTFIAENPNEVPDVVFLDINMPILNGWTFIEDLRNIEGVDSSKIQIYMMSSSFDRRDIEKSQEYPEVKDYLVKPVSRLQIRTALGLTE